MTLTKVYVSLNDFDIGLPIAVRTLELATGGVSSEQLSVGFRGFPAQQLIEEIFGSGD